MVFAMSTDAGFVAQLLHDASALNCRRRINQAYAFGFAGEHSRWMPGGIQDFP